MKIIRYPHYQPLTTPTAVTIGNFDGVHLGHQALIKQTLAEAKTHNLATVVVIMEPLPIQFFKGRFAVQLLTPFKQKVQLLKAMGVDILCVLNFNERLATLSAHSFLHDIVFKGLCSHSVIVGHDFRFGANRGGDVEMLQSYGDAVDIKTIIMPPIKVTDQRISSTAIRELLSMGNFTQAKRALGRDYSIIGRVCHGRKMGRELSYPTLNIELDKGGNPLHGVYVVRVKLGGNWYQASASVGYNPTVGGNAKRLEVHVLDFEADVYGQTVEVLFYKKLRNEVKFDSLCALRNAIKNDVQQTRDFFAQQKGELV